MSWNDYAYGLAAAIRSAPDAGPVHVGELHLRDDTRLTELFTAPVDGERDRLRGWRVVRDSVAEEWWSSLRTTATERYTLIGLQGAREGSASAVEFQAHVDAVLAAVRAVPTLADADTVGPAGYQSLGYQEIAGRACHYVEVAVEIVDHPTIGTAEQLPVPATDASARDGYAQAAASIERYIKTVPGVGRTHIERPFGDDWTDLVDLFTVPDDTRTDGKAIDCWRIFRDGNSEGRNITGTVTARADWRLLYHAQLADSLGTYERFQRQIDDVRGVFRAVAGLGNTLNPSLVLSSPLQVRSIDTRSLMGVGCHLADCSMSAEEVVHA